MARDHLDHALIARIVVVFAALAVSIAASLVFLPVAALVDPVIRAGATEVSIFGVFTWLADAFGSEGSAAGMAFLAVLWTFAVTICVAPVLIVSLVGEAARATSVLFYVAGTGLLAVALPWSLRVRRLEAPSSEALSGGLGPRLSALFFLTGACAGLIYWLIAGRGAKQNQPRG